MPIELLFDPYIKLVQNKKNLDEMEFLLSDFLKPLGLYEYVPKFAECKCHKLREIMSFSDMDLKNLGMKESSQRKLLLHRLSSM